MSDLRIQVADGSLLVRVCMSSGQLAAFRRRFNEPDLPYPSPGDVVTLTKDGRKHDYFVVSVAPTDDGVELTATLAADRPSDPKPTSFRRRRLLELRQSARRQA